MVHGGKSPKHYSERAHATARHGTSRELRGRAGPAALARSRIPASPRRAQRAPAPLRPHDRHRRRVRAGRGGLPPVDRARREPAPSTARWRRPAGLDWWTIATPTLGAWSPALLLQYVVPGARGSGIPQVKVAFASGGRPAPLRDAVGKFFIGALQIGSGVVARARGPDGADLRGPRERARAPGAALADRAVRRLLPVGAAAGIAAAFNAPIAAVTFTIEEVVGTARPDGALGRHRRRGAGRRHRAQRARGAPGLRRRPSPTGSTTPRSLLLYAVLGVAAAIVVGRSSPTRCSRCAPVPAACKLLPRWAQPAVGGLVTGVLAVGADGVRCASTASPAAATRVLGAALSGKLAVRRACSCSAS